MKRWVLLTLLAVGVVSFFFATSEAFAFGRRGRCGIFNRGCVQSCGTVCSAPVCNTVCTPIVEVVHHETPVFAYPVLVPAFQFQYVPTTYAVPTVPVTGYPQAYPVINPAVGAYGYPQVGQPAYGMPQQPYGYQPPTAYYPQQQQFQQQQFQQQQQPQQFGLSKKDQIRELARAILEEMNKITDGTTDTDPPAVPGTQPQLQPQLQQPQSQAPRQPDPQLTQVAFNAFGRTCSHCHTGVGSKKGFQLFTQPNIVNQNTNWRKVKEEIVNESMPPKDTQFHISSFERQSILEWLRQIGVN